MPKLLQVDLPDSGIASLPASNEMNYRVYVDATIVYIEGKESPKRTFIAYVVDGLPNLQGVTEVKAEQTHETELYAIKFAINELKEKLEQFTILCDHQSVVSEINRKDSKLAKKSGILREILKLKEPHPKVSVERTYNPAHTLLDEYILEHKIE